MPPSGRGSSCPTPSAWRVCPRANEGATDHEYVQPIRGQSASVPTDKRPAHRRGLRLSGWCPVLGRRHHGVPIHDPQQVGDPLKMPEFALTRVVGAGFGVPELPANQDTVDGALIGGIRPGRRKLRGLSDHRRWEPHPGDCWLHHRRHHGKRPQKSSDSHVATGANAPKGTSE